MKENIRAIFAYIAANFRIESNIGKRSNILNFEYESNIRPFLIGRAGIDPLRVRHINLSLWSRRLCSNVSRLRLVSMSNHFVVRSRP